MKQRDIRFDIARAVCMCYIIAVLHLSQYLGIEHYIYETYIGRLVTFSCLGLFTFMSGYLIGKNNDFTPSKQSSEAPTQKAFAFYKKRFLRIYPLFFIATVLLWLIGFNDLLPSVFGLLGVAPFVAYQPKTMWYISMLIVFYLITPLINRYSIKWKIAMSFCLLIVFGVAKLVMHVDTRFLFNFFFYCLGLVLSGVNYAYIHDADYLNIKKHVVVIIVFIALTLLTNRYFSKSVALLSVGALGVWALFSLSCLMARIKNQRFVKVIDFASYASMVCYLFHRFYYWVGLSLCDPEKMMVKVVLLIVVFAVGLVISYFIQKGYDKIVQHVE